MRHPPVCEKCGRHIEWKLQPSKNTHNIRWIAYDKMLKKKHVAACHNGEPKFKTYDRVIAFWPKAVHIYKITCINPRTLEYNVLDEDSKIKTIDFVVAEKTFKILDKIYELLYL